MIYICDLTEDSNGTLLVTCPAFPEVTTFGEDRAWVRLNAVKAIEEAIAARISDGDPIPSASSEAKLKKIALKKGQMWVKLPLLTAVKTQLYKTLRKKEVSRAELARRLGWHREQVERLFRLDHASRLDQIEAAFQALDRKIDLQVRENA